LIFFDEIDGLVPKRSNDGNQVIERVVNQLLTELNGVDSQEELFIIGATNRPDIIDTAILRPERLGVHLKVPLPSKEERK
jgi:ribosome biogenesis ATPase